MEALMEKVVEKIGPIKQRTALMDYTTEMEFAITSCDAVRFFSNLENVDNLVDDIRGRDFRNTVKIINEAVDEMMGDFCGRCGNTKRRKSIHAEEGVW